MKPLLSIIIPALNEEECLPKLLADIEKQTVKRYEVIVIDASSTDRTKERALEFAERIPLRVLTTRKRNVSYQRNKGAKAARGEYLMILDADFRLSKYFMKRFVSVLDKQKYLVLIPSLAPQKNTFHDATYTKLSSLLAEVAHSFGNPLPPSSCVIIQKDMFNFIGGYDEKLVMSEDQEIVQRAYRHGIQPKIMPNVEVKFSLRRFEQEGSLNVYMKYIIGSFHSLTNSRIEDHIFDYNMGGHVYKENEKKEEKTFDQIVSEQVDAFKTEVAKLVKAFKPTPAKVKPAKVTSR